MALSLAHGVAPVPVRAGLADPDADVRTEVVKALAHLGAYLRRHGMGQVIQEIASWLPTGRDAR